VQTRRDHLHAYQAATGRLASALVSGDPGTGAPPMRRAGLGSMFGVMLACLLVLAALVYGFLKPAGNTSWATNGALVVEQETGTRYLYADGQLHPTANYASAVLASGGRGMQYVARSALAKVPRGTTIGVPGAPDEVVDAKSLLTGSWADCLRPGRTVGETLDFAPGTVQAVTASTHVLVSGKNATRYVVWENSKYPVDRSSLVALGMDTDHPVPATSAWLGALPTGPAIAAAKIPGAGGSTRIVAGKAELTGTLLRTDVNGTSHYYVLESDGVASLTATESALLAGAPGGREPVRVSPSDIAALPSSADTSLLHRIPDLVSGIDGTGDNSALCLMQTMKGSLLHSTVVRETGRAASNTAAAALIPPEAGVLATGPASSAGATTTEPYLITDRAVKYPLSSDALGALGFSGVTPRVLPQTTLDQITTGPQLSRSKALTAVPGVN
jgi:type VII secretion protein EccB